jgi:hypothetical protein
MVALTENEHFLSSLLQTLGSDLGLFHSGVSVFVPESTDIYFSLYLNTRLFFYKEMDSNFVMLERYAIRGGPIITQEIGLWSRTTHKTIKINNIWERRSNLRGVKFRCATIEIPLMSKLTYDQNKNSTHGTGYFLEPFNMLKPNLNFTVDFYTSPDGLFGMEINGSWNGLIGMLISDVVDIVTTATTSTLARREVVDFSITLMEEEITLIAHESKKQEIQVSVYMDIFPIISWCICGAMILTVSLGFLLINFTGINSFHTDHDSEQFKILNSLGLTLLMLVQTSYTVMVKSFSAKMLFFFAGIAFFLIYSYYTADLTARDGIHQIVNRFLERFRYMCPLVFSCVFSSKKEFRKVGESLLS